MRKSQLICSVIFIVLLALIASIACAEINTSWVGLKDVNSGNIINARVGNEWYPIQFYFDGTAISAEGGELYIRSVLNLGTPQATPFNLETLVGQKEWYQALPAVLKPVAKDLRLQATNEDVSQ